MSIEMPASEPDSSMAVRQVWRSKTRKKWQRDWVGFLALFPWKPLFCPLPSCLAFRHTMRWKVNCPSTKQVGVVHGKEEAEDSAGWKMHKNWKKERKKKKPQRPSAAGTAGERSLTGHFALSGLHVTWYQVDRFLSLALSSSKPDRKVFKEQRNNTHED